MAGNAGTGILGLGSVTDPTAWTPDQYSINFIDSSNYEVLDSSAGIVSTGSYQPGDNIAFGGIEFSLQGQPLGGDQFQVAPSRNQDVFTTIDRIITAVETGVSDDASGAAMNNLINAELQNIDQAIGNVLDIRTQVGSRLSAIDSQLDSNGGLAITYQETLAGIEDLDYAEAISRMSIEMTTLEAAQQSFVRTQSLSLFNYL